MKHIILLSLFLFSCLSDSPKIVDNLGIILDAQVLPVNFSQDDRMQIKTSKAVLVIHGKPIVKIGDTLYLAKVKGHFCDYVTWESAPRFYIVY